MKQQFVIALLLPSMVLAQVPQQQQQQQLPQPANYQLPTYAQDWQIEQPLPIPDIKPFLDVVPVTIDINREPGGVQMDRIITPELAAGAMAAENRDGGITAYTSYAILSAVASPNLLPIEKENLVSDITERYFEYKNRRADTTFDAKTRSQKDAEYFVGIGQRLTKAAVKLSLGPIGLAGGGEFADIGLDVMVDHIKSGQPEVMSKLADNSVGQFRLANLQEAEIYTQLFTLAQGSKSADKILQKGKFYLVNGGVDPRMTRKALDVKFPESATKNMLEKMIDDKKLAKTPAELDLIDTAAKKALNQALTEYTQKLETLSDRIAKEENVAARRELAEEINFYGRGVANAMFLGSLLLKDPGDRKAMAATGKCIAAIAGAVAELSVNLVKYSGIMATGQFYLAVGVAIADLVSSLTGPSDKELILAAIKGVREHLQEMENRLMGRLLSIENRLDQMAAEIRQMFGVVIAEVQAGRNQTAYVKAHLVHFENVSKLFHVQYLSIEYDKRIQERGERLRNCFPPSDAKQFDECLDTFYKMTLEASDTQATGAPWTVGNWPELPQLSAPYFHQLGTIQAASMKQGDLSLRSGGIGMTLPDGKTVYRPVNPVEWADTAQKFILFSKASLDYIPTNLVKYRSTMNTIISAGESSSRAMLNLGALKVVSADPNVDRMKEIQEGRGSNAILSTIERYRNSLSQLQSAVQASRKEFEAFALANYSLNKPVAEISPRLEAAPKRNDNVGARFKAPQVPLCGQDDQTIKAFLESTAPFDSAPELRNDISTGLLASSFPDWRFNLPPDFSLLLPKSVRLHQDLSSKLDAFLRARDKDLIKDTDLTQRNLGICLESLSWGNRFSLAHLVSQRATANYFRDEVYDDEDVMAALSPDEKAVVDKAAQRLFSDKDHFGHPILDDYLTLSAADVATIDSALSIVRKRGAGELARDNRIEIENVFEFGYPIAEFRVYYGVDSSKSSRERLVSRVKLVGKQPVQFAAAQVDYAGRGGPEVWQAYERQLKTYRPGQGPAPVKPPFRSVDSVPEITGSFAGRRYYNAHGNKQMNHFENLDKPTYEGSSQLILGTHDDKHQKLNKPLLFGALVNLSNSVNGHFLTNSENSIATTEDDLLAQGFTLVGPSDNEKKYLSDLDTELRQYWAAQRIQFDQLVSSATLAHQSHPYLPSLNGITDAAQTSRAMVQLLESFVYLTFPSSLQTMPELYSALVSTNNSDLMLGDARFKKLRQQSSTREWSSEVGESDEKTRERLLESLDPDVNLAIYSDSLGKVEKLEARVKELGLKRTPIARVTPVVEQKSATTLREGVGLTEMENAEEQPLLYENLDRVRALNIHIEGRLPKNDLAEMESEIYRFLMDRYGK